MSSDNVPHLARPTCRRACAPWSVPSVWRSARSIAPCSAWHRFTPRLASSALCPWRVPGQRAPLLCAGDAHGLDVCADGSRPAELLSCLDRELGLTLPAPGTPKANYTIACWESPTRLYVSGHLPIK
eukprot:scaffold29014_cov118-Isochrysis_galbana.AAC.5